MPTYPYRCESCGRSREVTGSIHNPPTLDVCSCGGRYRRVFHSPGFRASFQPHFNWSAGEYVRTKSEFEDALKRKSDEATARTGLEHNFVPRDHPPNQDEA